MRYLLLLIVLVVVIHFASQRLARVIAETLRSEIAAASVEY